MYIISANHSLQSALEVASMINYFVQNLFSDKYFELAIRDGDGVESKLMLRPILEQDYFLSADESQIIRCIADDGKRIDILIPPVGLKAIQPATVVVGK